jgi:Uma2 family endonuclease
MGTKTLITPEEYLRMSFPDYDREYVDGELVERAMPNFDHGSWSIELALRMGPMVKSHGLRMCSDTRMCVAPGRYRIPDLAIFVQKPEQVPTTPPLVIIEIVSPDDRHAEIIEKLEDYRQWGVPNIWLADPNNRRFQVYTESGLANVVAFVLPEYGLELPAADLL